MQIQTYTNHALAVSTMLNKRHMFLINVPLICKRNFLLIEMYLCLFTGL